MQAEVVTIGTELLLGHIVDTNSAWIAQQLSQIGLNLFYTVTVGDNLGRIRDTLRAGLSRSDVVITTGGLGPTVDDMTREAVAQATGRRLVRDEVLLAEITAFFAQRGRTMTENNQRQAHLPEGAMLIRNPVGTAPSFAVEQDDHVVICLPGVPLEMRYLMEHSVLPFLRERFGLHGVIKSRTLRTSNIGESALGSLIDDLMEQENPTVGTAAHPGQTDVRITAKADTEAEADRLIAPVEQKLRERLGEWVFGADQDTLSDVVSALLAERGLRLATLETASDGELAQRLNQAPNAAAAYAGGVVAPGTTALATLLGLEPTSSVEAEPTQELADRAAQAVRARLSAHLGLAIVGVPEREATDSSPVFYSLAHAEGCLQATPRMGRRGVSGRGWLLHGAMDLVRRHLLGLPLE